MPVCNRKPDPRLTYELVATLDPVGVEELHRCGIELERETEYDAAGPTRFAYVTSDRYEFLLIYHPDAPIPAVDVHAATPGPEALQRLVANFDGGFGLVTWRADVF